MVSRKSVPVRIWCCVFPTITDSDEALAEKIRVVTGEQSVDFPCGSTKGAA